MTLERERIERLAIDQALGALDEDVDALLAVYLERDPDAARLAAAFIDTTLLTRRALVQGERRADPHATPLPPFPADRLRASTPGRTRLMRLTRAAAVMAACLLMGLLLGAGLGRRAGISPARLPVVRHMPPAPPVNDTSLAHSPPGGPLFGAPLRETAGSDLWSTRRLVARAGSQQGRTSAPRALRWASPDRVHLKEEQQ
jgi:hypothetical protein